MARGKVWVRPGTFAAKVITAPNSPRQAAKPTMAAASTPGPASGRVMLKNRSRGLAPRLRAASSSRGSTASSDRATARTISGKAITPAAREAPAELNTSLTPNSRSRGAPRGPRTPKARSSR